MEHGDAPLDWRTSSYSGANANCDEVAPLQDTAARRTSSYSENGANCVQVTPALPGVLLRDTKDTGTGPVVAFTAQEWTAFLAEVAADSAGANGAITVVHTGAGTEVHGVAGGERLRFTPSEWVAFRDGVRDGEFDLLITR